MEAVFEGEPIKIAQMTEWCKKGPPFSRVDHVHTETETTLSHFETFDILY